MLVTKGQILRVSDYYLVLARLAQSLLLNAQMANFGHKLIGMHEQA